MSIHIDISKDKIAVFCLRNHIRELALFGSALRDDFGPAGRLTEADLFFPAAALPAACSGFESNRGRSSREPFGRVVLGFLVPGFRLAVAMPCPFRIFSEIEV